MSRIRLSAPTHGVLAILALTFLLANRLEAQQPSARPVPDSAAMAQAFSGMMGQMNPMYIAMSKATIEGSMEAFEQPATVDRLAAIMHHYFEALVKAGFSTDQAMQIVAGAGVPMGKPGK